MNNGQVRLILLAEDDPTNALLLRRALGKVASDVTLTVVGNGEQAVQYLKGEQEYGDRDRYPAPDLVVTDIKMPRMNGMELLVWIKQQPELSSLPVLILSSADDPDEIAQMLALGAAAYLLRPGSSRELVEIAQKIVTFLT